MATAMRSTCAAVEELAKDTADGGPAILIGTPWVEHAELYNAMALLEDMAHIDEDFLRLRRERTDAFVSRNARAIRRLQKQGLADPELDPQIAALIGHVEAVAATARYGSAKVIREEPAATATYCLPSIE